MSWYYGQLPEWMSAYDRPDKYVTDICVTHGKARVFFEVVQHATRDEKIALAVQAKQELITTEKVAAALTAPRGK